MPPRPAETFGHKAFFRRAIMHKDHIRIPAPPNIQGLAGAQSHHTHTNAGFTREDRQDMAKQPGLFRAGGGSNGNAAFLRQSGQRKSRHKHGQYRTTKQMHHVNSPCWK
jgi:hypothetical protein